VKFCEESFSSGIIYSNATVELICEFSSRQFTDYDRKDRLLLPVHILQSQEYIVLEQRLGQVKKECFMVTFYFGRQSLEYDQMIAFRDLVLARSYFGRACIKIYYKAGHVLVQYLYDKPLITKLLRPVVAVLISLLCKVKSPLSGVSNTGQ
jgi:hypothetical protein